MAILWTPDQILFLTGIALAIAILIGGEFLETRRERPRLPIRAGAVPTRLGTADVERVLRSLPRASREAWQVHRLTALD